MDRDQDHWPESYSDLSSSMGNNACYAKSGDMECDTDHSSLTTDLTDIFAFLRSSVGITFIRE